MRNILLPPLMKELMFYFSYFLDSPTLPALSAYNPNPSSPSSNLSSSLTLVHPPSCWVSTHSPSEHPRILEINGHCCPNLIEIILLLTVRSWCHMAELPILGKFNLHWLWEGEKQARRGLMVHVAWLHQWVTAIDLSKAWLLTRNLIGGRNGASLGGKKLKGMKWSGRQVASS